MTIGKNIRRIRTSNDLTQEEFGAIAGVSSMAVSQWENDRAVPRMGAVQLISDYFSIPKSEIIDAENDGEADHNKLVEMRERAGLTQQQLADKLGVTQQTIWYYENGRREIKSSVLIEMSKALDCTVSELLGITEVAGIVPNREHIMHRMPVLGRIAAGDPREAIEQADEWHDTRDELWRGHENAFWLIVSGASMNRLFPEGSLVLIDPDLEVRGGDVGAVFVNGYDATIKRVFYEPGAVRLHPESYDPDYLDRVIAYDDDNAPDFVAIGRAISYSAPDGWKA